MLTIQHGHCCRSLLIALLLTLLGVNTTSAQVETLDQIVAIVDDDIILASELRERLTLVTQNLERQDVELPEQEILVRETLDRLILESIQMQLALRYGIRIPDAQLDDAMRRMAGQNNLTLEQFRGAVEAQGESFFAMREQVRQELTLQRVQQGNVNRGIEISEQEVDNFMGTDEGEAMTQPEFRVVQALVEVSKNDSKAEKASKEAFVDRVLAQILAGQAFDEAVSGTDLYAFKGGDLGWRKLADIPSMFTDVIPALGAGDTAKVTSGAGFHLVYLVDERGRKRMIDQTEVRHILIKPNEVLDDQAAKALTLSLRQRILDGEAFEALAKEFSDDIGSAQEGGELGWTSPGQMVPEFEAAMGETPVGEMSEAIRSEFGWHVLEVTGRREQNIAEDMRRRQVMNYLHDQKYEEELEAWLRKIREEAFVYIK